MSENKCGYHIKNINLRSYRFNNILCLKYHKKIIITTKRCSKFVSSSLQKATAWLYMLFHFGKKLIRVGGHGATCSNKNRSGKRQLTKAVVLMSCFLSL